MLLDEKRTKRIVRIIAILTSIAFAGVGAIVIALVIFGGSTSASEQLVKDAKSAVESSPNDAEAWNRLASAYLADRKFTDALAPAKKAVSLGPEDFSNTQVLVSVQTQLGNPEGAITALQDFTKRVPDEPQAFLQLGQLAQQQGRTALARLSYSAYLTLNPEGATADAVREALESLTGSGTTTTP
ncbi:MAG: tetratricopeptide repeat protein [Thermoleophilia bacterium]|nr:tetratricopeptide repeat protein [Thermoleophilia bacterium]